MTPRQWRLVRYGLGATGLVALIGVAVLGLERRPLAADRSAGIDDVLLRKLPDDVPRIAFEDVTAAAGIEFRHFGATRSRLLPEDMGPGLAWGDCDGDSHPDLYLVNFAAPLLAAESVLQAAPGNALYRNRGDGTFAAIGAGSGADLRGHFLGASFADYDGDGDLDLYVTAYGANVLLRNEGGCRFVDVTAKLGVGGAETDFSAGATWGDYDRDGDLDLYVTNYVRFDERLAAAGISSMQFGQAVPFTLNPASYEPAPNRLFRNDGSGFAEVAVEAGVANLAGRSLSAAWVDFDEDGLTDLYVANDISDNALYRNVGGGRFEDISAESLTADYRGAMGLAITDFDRDGDLDFFVTHWIAQENGLYANHLEVGTETIFFADVAELMGLGYTALEVVGWGTEFVDFDNDGYKDLFVANGHTLETKADPTLLVPQRMQLFWRRGEEGFFDATAAAGPAFERKLTARGAAAADYDGDGNIDIAVAQAGGSPLLLRNPGVPGRHWVELDLVQPEGNRFAVGATVTVEAGGVRQKHGVGISPSYLSQGALTVHFGLGEASAVDRITVVWPDGVLESWAGLAVDLRHRLERGSGSAPVESR